VTRPSWLCSHDDVEVAGRKPRPLDRTGTCDATSVGIRGGGGDEETHDRTSADPDRDGPQGDLGHERQRRAVDQPQQRPDRDPGGCAGSKSGKHWPDAFDSEISGDDRYRVVFDALILEVIRSEACAFQRLV
jgi:hypothetical protein